MRIIKTEGSRFIIKEDMFTKAEPVLWFDCGLFIIIPIQLIQNALDNLEMYKKLMYKTRHPLVYITWDQGIPVDPEVGYALMGTDI